MFAASPSARALHLSADSSAAPANREAHAVDSAATAAPNQDIFAFPSYDSDTGIGAGIKVFFLNHLGWNESLDLTAYASAKNERWVNVVFSLPDIETRQGTRYPAAVDVVFDYDKYLLANFFPGYDNGTDAGVETYTREPVDVSATFSRGITPSFVASLGVRFKTVSTYGFMDGSRIFAAAPPSAAGTSSLTSAVVRSRYDTRDSYINPHRGFVAVAEVEHGIHTFEGAHRDMTRFMLGFQAYGEALFPHTVAAVRIMMQTVNTGDAPLWMLNSLGGTSTLRGFAADRFLGKTMVLTNSEARFPVYRRLGGVLFVDAGNVSRGPGAYRWDTIHTAPGAGLRLIFDTFVVRADLGFSSEGGGLYLNFGQLF